MDASNVFPGGDRADPPRSGGSRSAAMSSWQGKFWVWLGTSSLAALLLLSLACDPVQAVTYENETDRTVTVFRDDTLIVTLEPSEKKKFSTLEFVEPRTFEAKDQSGRVIYSETLTWDELKAQGWRIVIEEQTAEP